MLKWMKVRQSASATTTTTLVSKTPVSVALRQETQENDEATTEAEVDAMEEGEDSGMEREDTVSNNELSDLKKVRFFALMIISPDCLAWPLSLSPLSGDLFLMTKAAVISFLIN